MPFQLRVTRGASLGTTYLLVDSYSTSIGRSIDCSIQLEDPSVSRRHCRVLVDGGSATIEDAGSSWGTKVNGESVTKCELKPGDAIAVGETELQFETITSPEAITLAKPVPPGVRGMETMLPSRESPISKPPDPPGSQQAATPSPPQQLAPHEAPLPNVANPPIPIAVPMGKLSRQESPADPTNLAGNRILSYDIQTVVARARSGIVYRALDSERKSDVAFKAFYPSMFEDLSAMQRFTRAVNTMLPIDHENLVRLYAAGQFEGFCYTACEFVDGDSAAQMIERIGISGMLPWEHTLRIAAYVARALAVAEEHNVIHRNVTPRNILVRSRDGVAKLGDLIYAKAVECLHSIQVTAPGELVGDLSYMSPEQTGAGGPVDCRSDIYCLGATLYALLTGRPPHEGRNPAETIAKIQTETPEDPTKYHLSIPSLFEGVILRMLAKRPDDRYQTATDLLADLERSAKYQGVSLP